MKLIHFFCGADFLRHALVIPTPERPFWLRTFNDAAVYLTRRFRGYALEFNTLPGAVEIPVVFWSGTGNAGFDLSFSDFDNCGGHVIPHLLRQANDVEFARVTNESICKLRGCLKARAQLGPEDPMPGDMVYLVGLRLGRQRRDATGRCIPGDKVNLGHVMMTAVLAGAYKCGGLGLRIPGYVSFSRTANLGGPAMWAGDGTEDGYALHMEGLESVTMTPFPPITRMPGDLGDLVPVAFPVSHYPTYIELV